MKVLVTGSNGFIAQNLISRLKLISEVKILEYKRGDSNNKLIKSLKEADLIFHLAGSNRPEKVSEFQRDNIDLTSDIVDNLKNSNFKNKKKIIFSSTTQTSVQNHYGKSKLKAEKILNKLSSKENITLVVLKLTNVYGKWSKPNYNSVVATFCFNVLNDLPIEIKEPDKILSLIYIDDLIDNFLQHINIPLEKIGSKSVRKYRIKLKNLAKKIKSFKSSELVQDVGKNFTRTIYATYISYKRPEEFMTDLTAHTDKRGKFLEIIKTTNSGQMSYFSVKPGITRGGHYHHSKSEKFLVVKGKAKFRFKHILTGEEFLISVDSKIPKLVETIPGWAHDITNLSKSETIVLLWSSEIFNPLFPDTYSKELH